MDALINTNPEKTVKIKAKQMTTTERYATNPVFREKMKAYMRARYRAKHPLKEKAEETHTEPTQATEPKDPNHTRNEKYANDKEYREKVKKQVSERYYKQREVELDLKNKIAKLLKILFMLL